MVRPQKKPRGRSLARRIPSMEAGVVAGLILATMLAGCGPRSEYQVNGADPFCIVQPGSKVASCTYLSADQCRDQNAYDVSTSMPEDRAHCVPNPKLR